MEDNAGYSQVKRIDEIINRKHVTVNGKQLHIPRKLSDRIFGTYQKEVRSSKEFLSNNDEIRVVYRDKYRYKPSALSRQVSRVVQSRLIKSFAEQLASAESVKGDRLDDSEVHNIALLEQSPVQDRELLQQRLFREFYKGSKF